MGLRWRVAITEMPKHLGDSVSILIVVMRQSWISQWLFEVYMQLVWRKRQYSKCDTCA